MIEVIRRVVRQELSRLVFGDVGEVVAVDWKQQRARVRLVSSGQETGWLAIGTGFASGGEGAVAPLAAGDRVWCAFADGRVGAFGVILGRVYGANAVPELPEGAFGVKRGSNKVLFDGDGKIVAEVAGCSLQSAGEVSIDGSVVKLGQVQGSGVKFEPLAAGLAAENAAQNAAIAAWIGLMAASLNAAFIPVVPGVPFVPVPLVLPAGDVSAARSAKVSLE